jgi:tetratricopeptide (TPR) repeat protein
VVVGLRARALYLLGRYDESYEATRHCEEISATDDPASRADWAPTRAKILARRGDQARAEAMAREAVDIVSVSDGLAQQAGALLDLAEILRGQKQTDEAISLVKRALDLYERKGVRPAAAACRRILSGQDPSLA